MKSVKFLVVWCCVQARMLTEVKVSSCHISYRYVAEEMCEMVCSSGNCWSIHSDSFLQKRPSVLY